MSAEWRTFDILMKEQNTGRRPNIYVPDCLYIYIQYLILMLLYSFILCVSIFQIILILDYKFSTAYKKMGLFAFSFCPSLWICLK